MTLQLGYCSNPNCHRPFAQGLDRWANYDEVVAEVNFPDKTTQRRVFSVCPDCKKKINKDMIRDICQDVLEFENHDIQASVMIPQHVKDNVKQNIKKFYINKIGHNVDDLK